MPANRKYSNDDPMVVACKTAIRKAGGAQLLAGQINRTWQAVYHWEVVPIVHVRKVARLAKMSVHTLRPDVFGIAPWKRRRIG